MVVARTLLPSVEVLSALPPNVPPRGCALLAGQALECALKAFLLHKGKKIIDPKIKHDLVVLWGIAYEQADLNIPKDPPDWVKILNSGHGPNFYLRYQIGQGKTVVHGGSTPALVPMARKLRQFIEAVSVAIGSLV
jgi:hypothetical protein